MKKTPKSSGTECWGAIFQKTNSKCCRFKMGTRHFQTKFCSICRKGPMRISLDRIRAIEEEVGVGNRRSGGFWTVAPKNWGTGFYRIVNNTHGCVGPRLVVFSEPPLADFGWAQLPDEWVSDGDGCIGFCLSKGTLVPEFTLNRRGGSDSDVPRRSSVLSTPQIAELPILATPITLGNRAASSIRQAHAALASFSALQSSGVSDVSDVTDITDVTDVTEPTATAKTAREIRMHKNRASAATSREKKRAYIARLEAQVATLQTTIFELQSENRRLVDLSSRDETNALSFVFNASDLDSFV